MTNGPGEAVGDTAPAGNGGGAASTDAAGRTSGSTAPELRVTTLELFFDLVFAFTLTQLTALLAGTPLWPAVPQVLLVFGLLWWMYGGYTWLTNARPPVHTAERLLLLVGMAGFLADSALIMVALGESVAAIGTGAARLAWQAGQLSAGLVTAALLGLALAAALWWVVAVAAGVQQAVERSDSAAPGPVSAAAVLAAGAALFLAGDVAFRRQLRISRVRLRAATAAAALVTTVAGALVALELQLALLTALVAAMLTLERLTGQDGAG